jgi:hypothetical protein
LACRRCIDDACEAADRHRWPKFDQHRASHTARARRNDLGLMPQCRFDSASDIPSAADRAMAEAHAARNGIVFDLRMEWST